MARGDQEKDPPKTKSWPGRGVDENNR